MASSKDPLNVESLTEEQKRGLEELKYLLLDSDRLLPEHYKYVQDDQYLMQWYKARKYNVKETEKMLWNHFDCRRILEMDTEDCLSKVSPILDEYYPGGQCGFDKMGHPIVYFPVGTVDPPGILNSVRVSDLLRGVMSWQESHRNACVEASKLFGKRIQQVIYIIDLDGLNVKHVCPMAVGTFKQVAHLVEQHTPEIVHKIFVINTPSLFYSIFNLIKPILDENTQEKIQVFAHSDWQEALLEDADADQLVAYYGGTKTDKNGDPKCSQYLTFGKEVPKELYFKSKEKREFALPENVLLTELNVQRGQQALVKVAVSCESAELEWYFESSGANEIGFGIFRVLDEEKLSNGHNPNETTLYTSKMAFGDDFEMVWPYWRMLSHMVPEWGRLALTKPGIYVLQFDNTYSWILGKQVHYYLNVTEKLENGEAESEV